MSDMEGDLQRRLANIVRRGVIHSTQHGKIPKCRVSIGELVTDWLPLCQGFSGGFPVSYTHLTLPTIRLV